MIACSLRIPRLPEEPDGQFARRRAKIAASYWNKETWRLMVATRIAKWNHKLQHAHRASWAALLVNHRGSAWLKERRATSGSASVFGGTLGSRLARSRPSTRFEESVEQAEAILAQHRNDRGRNSKCVDIFKVHVEPESS